MRRLLALLPLALLATVLTGCRFSLQGLPRPGGVGGPAYTVHATFTDVLNLPIGAQVRVGDAEVGQVTKIAVSGFTAVVDLTVHDDVKLPTGTTAQVRFDSPLGTEFVQLTAPTATGTSYLADGAGIPVTATGTAPSVEDTFAALDYVLNGGAVRPLGVIVDQLNQALDGHQSQARALVEDLDATLRTLAAHTTDIDHAITTLQQVSAQLAAGSGTLSNGLAAAAPATAVLAQQTQAFSTLNADLAQLAATADALVRQTSSAASADIRTLAPVAQQLADIRTQLAPALSSIATFERRLPTTTPGDYLQLSTLVKGYLQNGAVPSRPAVNGPGAPTLSDFLRSGS